MRPSADVSLAASDFEIDTDANLKVRSTPTPSIDWASVDRDVRQAGRAVQRRGRRLVRPGRQGGHRGPDGRRRQHPAEQERPDDLRRVPRGRRRATTSCTCSGTASRTRPARRTWTSSSTSPRRSSAQRRDARADRRRPADPVRPGQGRHRSRAVPLAMGRRRGQQVPVRGGERTPCWGDRVNLSDVGRCDRIDQHVSRSRRPTPTGSAPSRLARSARRQSTSTALVRRSAASSFGSAYLKSRSSDSFTAALKDFIAPTDDRPQQLRRAQDREDEEARRGQSRAPARMLASCSRVTGGDLLARHDRSTTDATCETCLPGTRCPVTTRVTEDDARRVRRDVVNPQTPTVVDTGCARRR